MDSIRIDNAEAILISAQINSVKKYVLIYYIQ